MAIYQIVCKAVFINTEQLRNVFHYEFAGIVPTTANLQELVDSYDSALKTRLQGFFSDEVDIYAYDVRRVDIGGLPASEFVPTAGVWSGTVIAAPLPSQVSLLLTWHAPTTYPRSTRSYMFPMTEDDNGSTGEPISALRTAALNFGNDVLTFTNASTPDPDKVAVQYSGTPRAVTVENDVQTVTVSNVWATQRSRRIGQGS